MYTLAILPLLLSLAFAVPHWPVAPAAQPAPAPVAQPAPAAPLQLVATTQFHAQDNLGKYSFGYASSDGNQVAQARNYDGTVAGRYSYVDANGKAVEVKYVADKLGFRAEGLHLPTGPEQPEALKLAYREAEQRLAAAKAKEALRAAAAAVAAPAPAAVPAQPVLTYGPVAPPQPIFFQPPAVPAVGQDFRAYTTHVIQEIPPPAPAAPAVETTAAIAAPAAAAPQVQPFNQFQTYRVGY